MSQESKNAWKDAKDDDIGVHLEADEQALRRTEEALLFKQFQVEDEEMAREAAYEQVHRTEEALLFKQFQVEDEEMAREALGGKNEKRMPRAPLEQRNAWRMRWKKKVVG